MEELGNARDFGQLLDWLLATVPRAPGATTRFTLEDVLNVLAATGPPARGQEPSSRSVALEWLTAMQNGRTHVADLRSRRYVSALEDFFRLPAGYFRHEEIRKIADERIVFAAASAIRGVRVIGPCRMKVADIAVDDLHRLHLRARELVSRRLPEG
jgi:hypothetical protein